MSDMIWTGVYILSRLGCLLLAYRILFRAQLKRKIWYHVLATVLIIAEAFALYMTGGASLVRSGAILYGTALPVILGGGSFVFWLSLYPTVYTATSIIDMTNSIIHSLYAGKPVSELMVDAADLALLHCTSLAFLLVTLYVVKRRIWTGTDPVALKRRQIVNYDVVCATLFLMTVSLMRMTGRSFEYDRSRDVFQVAVIIAGLLLFYLTFYSQYLAREREYQSRQLDMYDIIANEQRKQVMNMIFRDEEIRRINHDIRNHLFAIKALGEKEDNRRIQEYCDDLFRAVDLDDAELTGDPAIDAVLSSMKARAASFDIEVDYRIRSKPGRHLRSFDLCTIISNFLENAIEACSLVNGSRWVRCSFYDYQENLIIKVINPCIGDVIISDDRLITTKPDKERHGFGSLNVKHAVAKYNGQVRYLKNGDLFEALVIL